MTSARTPAQRPYPMASLGSNKYRVTDLARTPTQRPYPVARCDVENRDLLRAFRKKRREWVNWFAADNPHSITGQLQQLLLDHGVFVILHRGAINAARDVDRPSALFNSLVFLFFEGSWARLQAIGIRRLLESGRYSGGKTKPPKLQVISLRRLAEDIQQNWHLFTRENFVCHDGIPFDTDTAERRYRRRFPSDGTLRMLPDRGRFAFSRSRSRHQAFDRLSGVNSATRQRDDCLPRHVIDGVLEALESHRFQKVIDTADKIVAHAADRISRSNATTNVRQPLRFSRIESVHRKLCRIANFLSVRLIWETDNDSFLPGLQFSPVEHLDEPWLVASELQIVGQSWRHYETKVRSYNASVPFSTGELVDR